MEEIEKKLKELTELLAVIPQECKGQSEQAMKNRWRYMRIRTAIHNLDD